MKTLPHLWTGLLMTLLTAAHTFAQSSQSLPLLPPPDAASLDRGRQLLLAHRLPEAEAYFRNYLTTNEQSARARYLLAQTLLLEDHPRQSLVEYTHAAQIETPTASDLVDVAKAYFLLDDYDAAKQWLKRSMEMDPNNPEAWYSLGRIQYTQRLFAESVTSFQRQLALEPRSVKAENNLGLALEGDNRTDEAVVAYRNALAWQADSPTPSEQPMINLAAVLIHRGQTVEALQLLSRAAVIAPKTEFIPMQLGRLYLQEGDLEEASHAFEKARDLAPDDAAAHFLLGKTYLRRGLKQKAQSEFQQSAAIRNKHPAPDVN